MQINTIINYVKGIYICSIVQILMVILLLISEQQAPQINIILGFFIPIYKHFVSIKNQSRSQSSSSTNSSSSPLLNQLILNKQFGSFSTASTSSSFNSLSSISSNSSTSSLNNEKKNILMTADEAVQQSQNQSQQPMLTRSKSEIQYVRGSSPQSDNLSQKNVTNISNLSLIHAKSQNTFSSNMQNSQTSTPNVFSENTNNILSYWPMYCVFLIIEQQFLPKTLTLRHDYQIMKCLFIFILRGYSYSIYIFAKETYQMKGFEPSLFTSPQHIHLKNEIIMQKIDDQLKCYSRFNISLSKQQPLKSTLAQQPYVPYRRSNS